MSIQVVRPQEIDYDPMTRRERNPNFLRTGYERRLLVATDDGFAWQSRPTKLKTAATLIPIPLSKSGSGRLRFLDEGGQVRDVPLEAGAYYFIPPNVPYQIETTGKGILEIFSRSSPLQQEILLAENFFHQAHGPVAPPLPRGDRPMSTLSGKPRRIEELIINDEAEAPSLLNPMSGQIFITNAVGKRIVELADGTRDVAAIVVELTREFKGIDQATARADAEEFLSASTQKGLVSWNP